MNALKRTKVKLPTRSRYIDPAPEVRRGRQHLPVQARQRQTGNAGVQH
ncbi:MAG: hypothetical protein PHE04_04380 [Bacteroidales bacterium]|nr:hypothetical protein [Bacteroidales bacterium]MDD3431710.1 hypothetical protein [Bacteroidales bacterium]MDD4361718.1 hypothetical protein [Bacteroidales bacterium]MDD4430332.1 hypothetical protein [Bacteroidales bacterium]